MHHALTRRQWHSGLLLLLVLLLLTLQPYGVQAQANTPAQSAERVRAALLQVQLSMSSDPAAAQQQLLTAQSAYQAGLATPLTQAAPAAERQVQAGFAAVNQALNGQNAPGVAAARAQIWTAFLSAGYTIVTQAIEQGDGPRAREWLALREFRRATRIARPNADATLAVNGFAANTVSADSALSAVQADFLDAYQSRLSEALGDLSTPDAQSYPAKRAESAALAAGYFTILAPAYQQQRGADAQLAIQQDLALLLQAAQSADTTTLVPTAERIAQALEGFRAAPLSEADRINRASKVNRYLSLIAPNYGRGVRNGQVINQIEVEEARTFRDAAEAALSDLLPELQAQDSTRTSQLRADLASIRDQITQLAPADTLQATTDSASAHFKALIPPAWLQSNPSADYDAIRELLAQVNKAIAAQQYPQAESARLEAYAILDAGPEIRLRALAPDQAVDLSGLFWQGNGTYDGLANLIAERASPEAIQATTVAIDEALKRAQNTVGSGNATPGAVIGNAAVIIFRQGLEAVVILASIFAGLRKASDQRFHRPLIIGVLAAGALSLITWFVLRALLTTFAQFGGRLEAIVSIISVSVLLLILNWFFHNIYWVGWLAGIQQRKKRGLLTPAASQFVALALVGFTSVYREGFETALFAQVLVLEAGPAIVVQGLLLGAIPVIILGLITFVVQAKLPYKLLLIVSGVLIGSVLIQMMGQTIHAMQAVRWMSVTPIHGIGVPYWMGIWFGIYPTWEGLAAQLGAATIVIGSYFLAQHQQRQKQATAPAAGPTTQIARKQPE